MKQTKYSCNGFIFDNYNDVIAYEAFIRKITGYFLAITEIKTK